MLYAANMSCGDFCCCCCQKCLEMFEVDFSLSFVMNRKQATLQRGHLGNTTSCKADDHKRTSSRECKNSFGWWRVQCRNSTLTKLFLSYKYNFYLHLKAVQNEQSQIFKNILLMINVIFLFSAVGKRWKSQHLNWIHGLTELLLMDVNKFKKFLVAWILGKDTKGRFPLTCLLRSSIILVIWIFFLPIVPVFLLSLVPEIMYFFLPFLSLSCFLQTRFLLQHVHSSVPKSLHSFLLNKNESQ